VKLDHLRLALAVALLALPLAACGKKGPPSLEPGEVSHYPRPYPAPNHDGGADPDEVVPPAPAPKPAETAKPADNAKPAQ